MFARLGCQFRFHTMLQPAILLTCHIGSQVLPNLRPGYVELARSIEVVASSSNGGSGGGDSKTAKAAASSAMAAEVAAAAVSAEDAANSGSEAEDGGDSEAGSEAQDEDADAAPAAAGAAAPSPARGSARRGGYTATGKAVAAALARASPGVKSGSGKSGRAKAAAASKPNADEVAPGPAELAAAETDEQTPVAVAKVSNAPLIGRFLRFASCTTLHSSQLAERRRQRERNHAVSLSVLAMYHSGAQSPMLMPLVSQQ